MLQRGVVVFLAISFNACLSQALRSEPPAEEIYSLDLWRISTALFVLGSTAALNAVGAFAWVGIVFANVPKSQFPSFVAKNGAGFRALTYTHFVAFGTALGGTLVRVLAEHPFWTTGGGAGTGDMGGWSSQLIGIAAVVGLAIFLYGVVALIHMFSVTICDSNGFEDCMWPGLGESTDATLQRYHAKVEREYKEQQQDRLMEKSSDASGSGGGSQSPELQATLRPMDAHQVATWLQSHPRLAALSEAATREGIDGAVLLEMVGMSPADASTYCSNLFPNCPRGLGMVLWRMINDGQ